MKEISREKFLKDYMTFKKETIWWKRFILKHKLYRELRLVRKEFLTPELHDTAIMEVPQRGYKSVYKKEVITAKKLYQFANLLNFIFNNNIGGHPFDDFYVEISRTADVYTANEVIRYCYTDNEFDVTFTLVSTKDDMDLTVNVTRTINSGNNYNFEIEFPNGMIDKESLAYFNTILNIIDIYCNLIKAHIKYYRIE